MKALITIFLWLLVCLLLASWLGPSLHVGLVPVFQVLPSFDFALWISAVLLLLAAVVWQRDPVFPVFVMLLATGLVLMRSDLVDNERTKPAKATITVLSLNVGQFSNDTAVVNETVHQINLAKPDVVCLQEFGLYYMWPDVASVSADFAERIGMPYYDFGPFEGNIFGTAFFSKYPITLVDTIFSMLSHTNEAKLYVIQVDSVAVRIINMHLQSYNLFGSRNEGIDYVKNIAEPLSRRKSQVKVLLDHPADIVMGDMNSSPGSMYYRSLAGRYCDVQRAFGKGMLPTHGWLPTRLDYVFIRKKLFSSGFERLTDFPSDHHGLFAKVEI